MSIKTKLHSGITAILKHKPPGPVEQSVGYPFMRRKVANPRYLSVADLRCAEAVASAITKTQKHARKPIIHLNPGPGLVVEKLLEKGFQEHFLVETREPMIDRIQARLGQRVPSGHVYCKNAFQINSLWQKGLWPTNHLNIQLPSVHWDQESPALVFGVVPFAQKGFVRQLAFHAAQGSSVFSLGRVEHFLFVPGVVYASLLATCYSNKNLYNARSVLLRIFFDLQYVLRARISSFLPVPILPTSKNSMWEDLIDYEHMYLLRLTPKKSVSDIPKESQFALFFFVHQLMSKPRERLLNGLSRWFERESFPYLDSSRPVGSLSAEEFINIFQELRLRHDFSSFMEIVERDSPYAFYQVFNTMS